MPDNRRKEQNPAKLFLKQYAPMAHYKRHLLMQEEQLPDEIARADTICADVINVITQVQNIRQRDLLMMRYVSNWPWARCLAEMQLCGYSERSTFSMHGKALQTVNKILDNRKSCSNLQ